MLLLIAEMLCLCGEPKEQDMGSSGERNNLKEGIEGACCEGLHSSPSTICDNVAEGPITNGDVDDGRMSKRKSSTASDVITTTWKPVLLVIPLRLGLTEINPMYISSLKASLKARPFWNATG